MKKSKYRTGGAWGRGALWLLIGLFPAVGGAEWIQTTAGPWRYDDAANWQGGVINNVFLPVGYAGVSQTIYMTNDVTLTTPIYNYHINAITVTLRGDGADRTLTLGGDFYYPTYVQTGPYNTLFQIGNNTAGQRLNVNLGASRTFQVGGNTNQPPHYQAHLTLYDNVSGAGCGLTKDGGGILNLYGTNSWNGTLYIKNGQVYLGNGTRAVLAATNIVIRQGTLIRYNTPDYWAGLKLDNGGGGYARNDRIPDSTWVALRGGLILLNGGNGVEVNETLGTLAAESGQCRLALSRPETYNVALTVTNFLRSVGATLMARGVTGYTNLGMGTATSDARIILSQINGANPSNANVNGIIPWGICQDADGYQDSTPYYLTYGDYGLTPLTNYVTDILTATATDNVRQAFFTLPAGTTTVNSVICSSNINSGATLKLTSGSMVFDVITGVTPPYPGCHIYADIDFNGNEGIIFTKGYLPPLVFDGQLKNTGGNGVTLSGGGTYSIGGNPRDMTFAVAQTYEGPTRLIGQVNLKPDPTDAIPTNSPMYIDDGSFLTIWSSPLRLGSLAGGGTVRSGFQDDSLIVGGNGSNTTFDGQLGMSHSSYLEKSLSLTKVGAGTLTLGGSNTYRYATTISNGALIVDGWLAGGGAVTNKSGATLGGGGYIAGPVVVENGATLAPGGSVGTLTLATNLTLNSSSILSYELGQPGALGGGTNDLVMVGGNLVLDGTLNVTAVTGFSYGTYTLIKCSGTITDNGLVLGTMPPLSARVGSYSLETTAAEVRLVVVSPRGTIFKIY
ncbi:MAG: autotransporter-associated beta strand repeat-containing protein [Kiritimatiellae bacterium]|nr:autotransporter-associated beta strand repeat-containing protein [Verrucomicrobiota bacterium]MBU4286348.1 autotransporter-associated beta strand repeat-containing protein [Verrucomicrobiota bacterium]MCG2659304.1 autotransporter-associated beta strand repeat-containing protein [Kiritimatiellia bacterium]